jgi:hypothetical protein
LAISTPRWPSCGRARKRWSSGGIPVVEGLAAFHHDAHAEAVELLLPVRFDLWQIGGSHAQRDVVNWTLTEAAVRARAAGRCPVACA